MGDWGANWVTLSYRDTQQLKVPRELHALESQSVAGRTPFIPLHPLVSGSMIRLARTERGDFPVRVVSGRVLLVSPQPTPDRVSEAGPPGPGCTRLVVEHDHQVRELSLVHLKPLDILPHRNITIVTGCEIEREWLLYIYSPNDKNHRRFDDHIARFLATQGTEPLSKADQRLLWSAILLQVWPDGTR